MVVLRYLMFSFDFQWLPFVFLGLPLVCLCFFSHDGLRFSDLLP